MASYLAKVTTVGTTGTAVFPEGIRGFLRGIRVEYGGTPAATTDVTIAEAAVDSLKRTLLTLASNITNGVWCPQQEIHDNAGAAQDQYTPFYLEGKSTITVTVAQAVADTANAVVVRLLISED